MLVHIRIDIKAACLAILFLQSFVHVIPQECAALGAEPQSGPGPLQQTVEITQAEQTRITPQLQTSTIAELRMPDVRLQSVVRISQPESRELHEAHEVDGAHIAVRGTIAGTIPFKLQLPNEWNGRFVMIGFVSRDRDIVNRRYATVEIDAKYFRSINDEAMWNNVEAQINHAYLAVHRVAEVAKSVIYAYYRADPRYSYFSGCSFGGGQALIEAQRYPDDFDGILSVAPITDSTGLTASRIHDAQTFFPDPNRLDQSLFTEDVVLRLHSEVLRQCDEEDGVKDGIIADPRNCRFDWSRLTNITDRHREALQSVYRGPRIDNQQVFPGMTLGSELGWYFRKIGSNKALLEQANGPNPGFISGIASSRVFVFNDPNWDYSTYDLSSWQKDSYLAGAILNATNPDLSKFKAAKGKLLLWHGWSDSAITPLSSIKYFEKVEELDPEVRDYFRLFLLPGVQHCGSGPGPSRFDWFGALTAWVERGRAPYHVIVSKLDDKGEVAMTRPVYPYPLRAVYTGSGSTNDAENYVLLDGDKPTKATD